MTTLDFGFKGEVMKMFPTLLLAPSPYWSGYTLHVLRYVMFWPYLLMSFHLLICFQIVNSDLKTDTCNGPSWFKEYHACTLCTLMCYISYQSCPVFFPECLHRSPVMSHEKDPLFHKAVPVWNGNKQFNIWCAFLSCSLYFYSRFL